MLRLTFFTAAVMAFVAISECSVGKIDSKFQVGKNLFQGTAKSPEFRVTKNGNTFTYKLGSNDSSAKLLAKSSGNHSFDKEDAKLTLKYNEDVTIYRVEITVDQTSDLSKAKVNSGGVGKNQIEILVEGGGITSFKWEANIYGTKN